MEDHLNRIPLIFCFFIAMFRIVVLIVQEKLLAGAGAIIGDGDRNWVSFSVMGLSLSKKTNVLFLAKIAPYARDARACNC